MKRVAWIFLVVIVFILFHTLAWAEFSIVFSREDARESEEYASFVFVFGAQMEILVNESGDFIGFHKIHILPATRERRNESGISFKDGIVIMFDDQMRIFAWISYEELVGGTIEEAARKITDTAIKFSTETYQEMKTVDGNRKKSTFL